VLARAIPIGEFSVGVAFLLGIRVRPAAVLALFLVLNFLFGTSAFFALEFLRDGTGPPLIAALIAMFMHGGAHTRRARARLEVS
jgi:uncharacterized membrane protein YphA (DoxX/SURF4 family)